MPSFTELCCNLHFICGEMMAWYLKLKRPGNSLSNPISLQDCPRLRFISSDQFYLFLKGWMNVWARVICPAFSLLSQCFVFSCSCYGCLLPCSCWGSQRSTGQTTTIHLSLEAYSFLGDTLELVLNVLCKCCHFPNSHVWMKWWTWKYSKQLKNISDKPEQSLVAFNGLTQRSLMDGNVGLSVGPSLWSW